MNKYVKNYIFNVANIIMSLLFPIITFPYVSRVLGPTSLGIINFAQSYGYYFLHIASFGINSYAIREASKVRDDKDGVDSLCNEIFNLNLFFSLLSLLLYFSGVLFVQNFRDNFAVFSLYSIVIVTNFLTLDWLLQSYDDYRFSTVRNLIIRTASLVAVFVFIHSQDDFVIYMAISCVSEMGVKLSSLLYCRKHYVKLRIRFRFFNFKAHIKPMFTLFTFRLVNGVSANLDKLMIGFMMAYSYVGIYSAGVKFVLMITPIIESVGIVLFPKINISANSSPEEYERNLKLNYDSILVLAIPMAVGMFLVSGRLIPLFAGEQYVDAVMVSRIMSIIIVLGPLGDMLGSKTLLVFSKDHWLLTCSVFVAISNIFLNCILIPVCGINGAAAASVISYCVAMGTRYYYTRKLVKIRLLSRNLIKYALFTAPFILIYILFGSQIDENTLWMLGFIVICIAIYAIELALSKDRFFLILIEKTIGKKE